MAASVGGGLVEDHGQADDLVVANAEIVRHDQLVRKIGLVVVAVVAGSHDGVAVMVDDFPHLQRDLVAYHLLFHPRSYGGEAGDLATGIVYVRVRGEGGDDGVDVESIDGGDVVGDHAR